MGVFIVVAFMIACYNAETVTGMFSPSQEDVCTDETCKSEKNAGVDPRNASPAGGLGGQERLETKTQQEQLQTPQLKQAVLNNKSVDTKKKTDPETINLIITFTNADSNSRLQEKFTLTVSSLLQHASVPIAIHVIGDDKSQTIAADILRKSAHHATSTYSVSISMGGYNVTGPHTKTAVMKSEFGSEI